MVPVIRDADGKRMRAIAREISDLAARARSKKLTADDISNGTFTITNPGPFGTLLTMPIINQPQVAILSTDGVKRRPVVVDRRRRHREHRHPLGRQPRPQLGPPRLRRRLRRRLPAARSRSSSRPGTGPPSCSMDRRPRPTSVARAVACTSGGSGRVRYRDGLGCSRGCSTSPRRPPAAARAPARVHARGPRRPRAPARDRRPRSAPSWCAPTAAATSPTTGPASWSATRS